MRKFSKLENCGQIKELYKCNCEACVNMTKVLEITNRILEMREIADEWVVDELIGPVGKINNFLKDEA